MVDLAIEKEQPSDSDVQPGARRLVPAVSQPGRRGESLLDRLINNSHQVFMNAPSYRPNKRPGRVIPTGNTSASYNKNRARTWGITRSKPLGNNVIVHILSAIRSFYCTQPSLQCLVWLRCQDHVHR